MDSVNKSKEPTIEEEVATPGALTVNELLAFSQETVAVESRTINANHSTVMLKTTAGDSWGEVADGLVVSTVVKRNVAITNHSKQQPADEP